MSFNQLGLSAELLRSVQTQGYQQATPIQQQAIPPILDGQDVLASAQTGTGKTAAFTLPLLNRLQNTQPDVRTRRVRALILTPTRELAAQVGENVRTCGQYLSIRATEIFGGVSINTQKAKLESGVDIIIATPGRLLDHINQKTVDLSRLEILVLDEADRMLDMGFIRDIRRIMERLPDRRQNLLFSATFSKEIRSLAAVLLNSPREIQVAQRNIAADKISQAVWLVAASRKRELLSHKIGAGNWQQVLVFTRTKHGADRLSRQLVQDGLEAVAIHGNKSQGARTRALANFKSGRTRVLVATDVAARGLDAERCDEETRTYIGLAIDGAVNASVVIDSDSVIVRPNVAEENRPEAAGAANGDESEALGTDGTPSQIGGEDNRHGGTASAEQLPTRFQGTVVISSDRPARDMHQVVEAIIEQLTTIPGASVELKLEIDAEVPAGIDKAKSRIILENASTLGFIDKKLQ
jgi:ATP-dependent RNA helicase RhlE